MRFRHLLLLLVMASTGAAAAAAQEAPYNLVLGVQDRLRITIYQWQEVSGDYGISYQGTVFLPLIGEVPASGKSPAELAEAISEQLQRVAELAERPRTSVEVIEYRPFYITGDVADPGAYAFRPGTVLLNAIALAGGYYRPSDGGGARGGRDIINAAGDRTGIEVRLRAVLAERARIEAEIAGADAIAFPKQITDELESSAELSALVDQQRSLFDARRKATTDQRDAIKARIESHSGEVTLLERSLALQGQQLSVLEEDYSTISGLADAGLVTNTRGVSLRLQINSVLEASTQTEVAILQAKDNMAKAQAELDALDSDTEIDLRAQLAELDIEYNTLQARLQTADSLIVEAQQFVSVESGKDETAGLVRSFTILRPAASGEIERLDATETTPLQPGDIIEIGSTAI